MLSVSEIREDLKDIKYYYSRKELFDSCSDEIGKLDMLKIILC